MNPAHHVGIFFSLFQRVVLTVLVPCLALALTSHPTMAEDFQAASPEKLLAGIESFLRASGALVKPLSEDMEGYRKLMVQTARRAEKDNNFKAALNQKISILIEEYIRDMPEEIKRLPNKPQLPDYDNLDRALTVLTNIQTTQPSLQARLKYLKFMLYGPNAFHIDDYPRLEEIEAKLRAHAENRPGLTRLIHYGDSVEGRPLLALEITDRSVPEWTKAVLEFDAAIHPPEITSVPVVLNIMDYLLQTDEENPETRRWLKKFRFLIIPLVNPDGYHYVLSGDVHQNNNAYVRKATLAGVNLNRNVPFAWNKTDPKEPDLTNPYYRSFRGPGPGSEPETRALMDLMLETRPVASVNFHSEGENFLYPSAKNDRNVAANLFEVLGEAYVREVTTDSGVIGGYQVGTAMEKYNFSPGGALIDWLWQELSTLAFVCELVDIKGKELPDQEYVRDLVRRQAPGWQNFIRRLESPGFRGAVTFADQADPADVTYRIVKQPPGSDDGLAAKSFPVRNRKGLIYSVVEPGEYLIVFEQKGRVVGETPLRVHQDLVDLGVLNLK